MSADFTRDLRDVVRDERKEGRSKAQWELETFAEWAEMNREAIEAIWEKARELAHKRGRISANYLTHWLREEWSGSKKGLGDKAYKVPNEFSPILGRYLKSDPELGMYIECKRSQYEGMELPAIGGIDG